MNKRKSCLQSTPEDSLKEVAKRTQKDNLISSKRKKIILKKKSKKILSSDKQIVFYIEKFIEISRKIFKARNILFQTSYLFNYRKKNLPPLKNKF